MVLPISLAFQPAPNSELRTPIISEFLDRSGTVIVISSSPVALISLNGRFSFPFSAFLAASTFFLVIFSLIYSLAFTCISR